jgi:hypothetical protein
MSSANYWSQHPRCPSQDKSGQPRIGKCCLIHRSRLAKVSQWFKRTAAHTEVIELDHVSGETVQAFYHWVYEDRVVEGLEEEMEKGDDRSDSEEEDDDRTNMDLYEAPSTRATEVVDLTEGADEDEAENDDSENTTPILDDTDLPWCLTSSPNVRGRIFGRLLDLYTFASTYEVHRFKLAVILTWQRFSHTTFTYPCATVIHNVRGQLPLSSGLVQYLIGCYTHKIYVDDIKENRLRWKGIPSDFLTEVVIVALERVEDDDEGRKPQSCWYDFHEHETEEAKTLCMDEEARENDPDVVYKVRARRPFRRFGGCC